MPPWTIKRLIAWAEGYFEEHGIDSPRLTAEILLAHVLGLRRLDLYLQHDRPLEAPELGGFKSLIKRRLGREPVAYITGERGFYNDTFRVAKGVLIPRPETELMVETALEFLRSDRFDVGCPQGRPARVLELGVGSGAVIVSVAKACPAHAYFGCDLSFAALQVAKENAQRLCDHPIHFFQGSWLAAADPEKGFDLILANPPYIPTKEISGLAPEVRQFEPDLALNGGEDGLDAFRAILAQDRLLPCGALLLEMGFDQRTGLENLASALPWVSSLTFKKDLAGHNRLAILKK